MTHKFTHVAVLMLVLSGCAAQGQVDNDVLQKISLCSGGHRQTLSADIQAKVAQDLRSGNLSATLANEIKGLFLNDQSLRPEDRIPAYELYIQCIKDIRI